MEDICEKNMPVAGYFAAALIGITLGLIGGGGSILTIPVLVYLFGISPVTATGYSLFIVGCTSLAGAIRNYTRHQVNINTGIYFGIASLITVFITRKFLIALIPEHLFFIGHIDVTKSLLTMILFAALMIVVSIKMITEKNVVKKIKNDKTISVHKIIIIGIGIGLITGLLGAGGGFLIIPVLIYIFNLPMKKAIGTSLFIISINSLVGFLGDIMNEKMNWEFLLSISAIAIAGVFIGDKLNERIDGKKLRKGFGWFILLLGVYIIGKEILV